MRTGSSRGGRLLAVGESPAARSDARHVAVEFVHPVIVGKRALPALAFERAEEVALMARPEDMVLAFDGEAPPGCFEVAIPAPPSDDPFIRQELTETYYHLLWELVHVFFEHGGRQSAGGGAASFLYPFLDDKATDVDALLADVARSVVMKADEVGALREQTLTEGRGDAARGGGGAARAARRRRRRCSRSATAARPPTRWTWSPTSAPPAGARSTSPRTRRSSPRSPTTSAPTRSSRAR